MQHVHQFIGFDFLPSETKESRKITRDWTEKRKINVPNFNLNGNDKDRYRPLSNDRDGFRSFSNEIEMRTLALGKRVETKLTKSLERPFEIFDPRRLVVQAKQQQLK